MNEIIPDILPFEDLDFDSQEVNRYVELLWFVRKSDAVFFGGQHSDIYWALLIQRMINDGLSTDDESLNRYFYRHLHRGIGSLVNISTKPTLHQMFALTAKE